MSADHTKSQCEEYFESMPWKAVPYENSDLRSKLSDTFSVEGIPTLVILNPGGSIRTKDGYIYNYI